MFITGFSKYPFTILHPFSEASINGITGFIQKLKIYLFKLAYHPP